MVDFKPALAADVEFLWQMLYYASYVDKEDGVTIADMKRNPDLIRHLDNWPNRPGDLGLVAVDGERPVGACWLRRLIGDEIADVTYVDDATPELVIAVEPDMVGQGVGSALLQQVLAAADATRLGQIVLTSRAVNPAVALYERSGFELTEQITNRVGTQSVKMIRRLPTTAP